MIGTAREEWETEQSSGWSSVTILSRNRLIKRGMFLTSDIKVTFLSMTE